MKSSRPIKRPRRFPRRRPVAGPEAPAAYRRWLRVSSRLKLALAAARERYLELPGVVSVGLGRKLLNSPAKYGPRPRSTLGLCVSVFVTQKLEPEILQRGQRVCRSLPVKIRGRQRPVRVMTDVVEIGSDGREEDAGWPTAGCMLSGARFTSSTHGVQDEAGTFGEGEALLGTTGAILAVGSFQYAVTAAHNFIRIEHGERMAPRDDRGVGVNGKRWARVSKDSFFPGRIESSGRLSDVIVLRVPEAFVRAGSDIWPPSFAGRLATADDVDRAIRSNKPEASVWVEREGSRESLRAYLDHGTDGFARTVGGRTIKYGFVWPIRYDGVGSVKGDSGAGVFIPAADGGTNGGELRLLSFHFYHNPEEGVAFSTDAETFLRAVMGEPGSDFQFLS